MTGSLRQRAFTLYAIATVLVAAGAATIATVMTNYLYRYSQFDGLIGQIDNTTYATLTEMYPTERTLFFTGVIAVLLGLALVGTVAVIRRRQEVQAYVDGIAADGME